MAQEGNEEEPKIIRNGPFANILISRGKATLRELERSSIKWLRAAARRIRGGINAKSDIFLAKGAVLSTQLQFGKMYMFYYDPKHKNDPTVLPYYDMLPLIFPIDVAKGGFLGINFHYLPRNARAILMDSLYRVSKIDPTKISENTRMKISYEILKSISRFDLVKPCIKHYLTDHVRSKFSPIPPEEWDIALMLPTERFVGAKVGKVYTDSVGRKR